MDEKLKPCPFCGVEMITAYDEAGFWGWKHPTYNKKNPCPIWLSEVRKENAAAWNRRAPAEVPQEVVEAAKSAVMVISAAKNAKEWPAAMVWDMNFALDALRPLISSGYDISTLNNIDGERG